MQKIENKFIYFILILIIFIIGFSIYISLFKKAVDRNTYVELIEGEGYVNETLLIKNQKQQLSINDIVKTTKENSLAIIEWGDGSITRLGGNSEIKVNELFVSQAKDKLNISFELLKGKSWSNVISYVPEDSYFKEIFMDKEAAIRGTIFNVDIERDYLYVIDHKVELSDSSGNKLLVEEKKPITLSNFSFIQLEEFIRNIRDNTFDEINRKFDIEFMNKLKLELQAKLDNFMKLSSKQFDKLSLEEKDLLYKEFLSTYQDLNFIKSTDDKELYDLKLILKEKLLNLAPVEEKKLLMESFVYDLKDSVNNKSYDSLEFILGVFNNNNDLIVNKEEIFNYLNKVNLGENIKSSLINNLNTLKSTFSTQLNIDTENIKDKALDLEEKAKDIIETGVNSLIK
ncbi:MAG: FecR domain-containing protein [Candidatus Gracilibacteria bacterium]|nr:FecR domain-containing protein [Candidatus Gracilibacteria bacterium]